MRDLFGTMDHERANKGILVTTSSYGPDAYDFAKGKQIELVDARYTRKLWTGGMKKAAYPSG